MKLLFYHCFTILLLVPKFAPGQSFETRRNQFFMVNVLTGGIIGGIGSAIHKHPGQTKAKAFLIGFRKGCLGGSLTFTGKYLAYGVKSEQSYSMSWPAKLIHAGGASIIENAARNDKWYSNWAMDLGPVRIDANMHGQAKFRVQPFAVIGMTAHFISGSQFSVKKTIQSGNCIFNLNPEIDAAGRTYINSIASDEGFKKTVHGTNAHEIIHVFQARELLAVNSFYLKNKYKWVYIDLPVFDVTYFIADKLSEGYFDNYYEKEADVLGKRGDLH